MANYYVSLTGSNSNPGTLNAPWRSIFNATYISGANLHPGDTIYIRGGRYVGDNISIGTNSGITVTSYPGELVTIDGGLPIGSNWQGPNTSGVYWFNCDSITGCWSHNGWSASGPVDPYEPALLYNSGMSFTDASSWWRAMLATDSNMNLYCMQDLINPPTGIIFSGVFVAADMTQHGLAYWDGGFMDPYNGYAGGLNNSGTRIYFRPPPTGGSGPLGAWTMTDVQNLTRVTYGFCDGIWAQNTAVGWTINNLKFCNSFDGLNGTYSGCIFSGLEFMGVGNGILGGIYNCTWVNNSIDNVGTEIFCLVAEIGNPNIKIGTIPTPYQQWNNSVAAQNQYTYGAMQSGITLYRGAGGGITTATIYMDHVLGRDASGLPTGLRVQILENSSPVFSGNYGTGSTLSGLLNDIKNIPTVGTYYTTGLAPGISGSYSAYYLGNTVNTVASSPSPTPINIYQTTGILLWMSHINTYTPAGGWNHGMYLSATPSYFGNLVSGSYIGSCQGECLSWRDGSGNIVVNNVLNNQFTGGNIFDFAETNGVFSGNVLLGQGYINFWPDSNNLQFKNNTLNFTNNADYSMGRLSYGSPYYSGFNMSNNILVMPFKYASAYDAARGYTYSPNTQLLISNPQTEIMDNNVYYNVTNTGLIRALVYTASGWNASGQSSPNWTNMVVAGTGIGPGTPICYFSGAPAWVYTSTSHDEQYPSQMYLLISGNNIDEPYIAGITGGGPNGTGYMKIYFNNITGVHPPGDKILPYWTSANWGNQTTLALNWLTGNPPNQKIQDYFYYMSGAYGLETHSLFTTNPQLDNSSIPLNPIVSGMGVGANMGYVAPNTTGILYSGIKSSFYLNDASPVSCVTFGVKTVMISGSGTSLIWDVQGTPQIIAPGASFSVSDGLQNYIINRT